MLRLGLLFSLHFGEIHKYVAIAKIRTNDTGDVLRHVIGIDMGKMV